MKLLSNVAIAAAMLLLIFSCNNQTNVGKDVNLSNELDSVSYSLGLNVAKNVQAQGLEEVNIDALMKAFNDVYEGNETILDEMQAGQCLQSYFQRAQLAKSDASKEAGVAFLTENKSKEGVITTDTELVR